MVSVEYIIKAALEHDTAMSRAFLRACGIAAAPKPAPCSQNVVSAEAAREMDPGLAWCFANHGSPMDAAMPWAR